MIIEGNSKRSIAEVNIFGNGELFNQVVPLLRCEGVEVSAVFDDTKQDMRFKSDDYHNRRVKETLYCIGYKNMKKRFERFTELKGSGVNFVSFAADNAIVSDMATIGNGSIINQGTIIDNYVALGECVFVNLGSIISHHTVVKNNVFIAPGVNIAGYVTVNEGVFLGINSTIIDHISIGEHAVVAAGAVVTQDVPPYTMVAGNPAVVKKQITI